MSLALARQIPSGAEVTVTLTSGKSFSGREASSPAQRDDELLQLEKYMTISGANGDKQLFITNYKDIASIEMKAIR